MDLSKYYEQICKEPILTREEEFSLFEIMKSSTATDKEKSKARDRVLRANLRFVFKTAKVYSKGDQTTFEDLVSAGNEGLLVGMEKYNPNRKVRFLSYSGWWILQRILKEMSKMRIVSLPIWKQQLASKITKVKDSQENVSFSDLEEAFPDVPKKDLAELSQTRYLTYYIDDLNEADFEVNPIQTEVEKNIDNKRLYEAIESMSGTHRDILIMSFGLEDGKEYSANNIAKKLGISRDSFKNLKAEAMEILKDKFNVLER